MCRKMMLIGVFGILTILPMSWLVDGELIKNVKRMALRSNDPLTRRSAGEKHFIRFGRNDIRSTHTLQRNSLANGFKHIDKRMVLNKREALFEEPTMSIDKDGVKNGDTYAYSNAFYLLPFLNAAAEEHVRKFGGVSSDAQNTSHSLAPLYDVNASYPNDEKTNNASSIRAFLSEKMKGRIADASVGADEEADFIRDARSESVRHFFDRHDRGRDNFMRLGRTDTSIGDGEWSYQKYGDILTYLGGRLKEQRNQRIRRKYDNFIRLGKAKEWNKKYDSNFMRLGRNADVSFDEDENFLPPMHDSGEGFSRHVRFNQPSIHGDHDRLPRKNSNFIRLGRAHEPELNIDDIDRSKQDGFEVDDGRMSGSVTRTHTKKNDRSERAPNFIRLGRGRSFTDVRAYDSDDVTIARDDTPTLNRQKERLKRKLDKAVRFGRSSPSFAAATMRLAMNRENSLHHDARVRSKSSHNHVKVKSVRNANAICSLLMLNKYSNFCLCAARNRSDGECENKSILYALRPLPTFANRMELATDSSSNQHTKEDNDSIDYDKQETRATDQLPYSNDLITKKSSVNAHWKHALMRWFLKNANTSQLTDDRFPVG